MFAAKLYCDYNDTVLKLLLYCYIYFRYVAVGVVFM